MEKAILERVYTVGLLKKKKNRGENKILGSISLYLPSEIL